MRVERAVAGALVCALGTTAVVACKIVEEPPKSAPNAPAPPPPPPATTAAPTPAAPAAPAAAQPAPAPAAPAKKVGFHLGGAGGAPAPAPAPAPAAACLDQGAATVPDCSTLQAPSPACAAFTTATQKCAAYKNNFDPKVAAAAIACLASASAQLCDATRPLTCAKGALAQACPDPNVAQLCQIAAGPCKSAPADCTSMLSGLSSQGQQAVAQCVATGCTAGLAGCIDALK